MIHPANAMTDYARFAGAVQQWRRGSQAIYAESADYYRRTIERQTHAFERCLQSDSLEASFDIQLDHWRSAFDDYRDHVSRIASLAVALISETGDQ